MRNIADLVEAAGLDMEFIRGVINEGGYVERSSKTRLTLGQTQALAKIIDAVYTGQAFTTASNAPPAEEPVVVGGMTREEESSYIKTLRGCECGGCKAELEGILKKKKDAATVSAAPPFIQEPLNTDENKQFLWDNAKLDPETGNLTNKVGLIKAIREKTNCGLKDAKDFVEEVLE